MEFYDRSFLAAMGRRRIGHNRLERTAVAIIRDLNVGIVEDSRVHVSYACKPIYFSSTISIGIMHQHRHARYLLVHAETFI